MTSEHKWTLVICIIIIMLLLCFFFINILITLDLLKELQRISYKSKKETEQENVILKKEVKRLQKGIHHFLY